MFDKHRQMNFKKMALRKRNVPKSFLILGALNHIHGFTR